MFGEVVGYVGLFGEPVYIDNTESLLILQPIEVHVDGEAAELFDGVMSESMGKVIISLYGSGGLYVTHFV